MWKTNKIVHIKVSVIGSDAPIWEFTDIVITGIQDSILGGTNIVFHMYLTPHVTLYCIKFIVKDWFTVNIS